MNLFFLLHVLNDIFILPFLIAEIVSAFTVFSAELSSAFRAAFSRGRSE